MKMPHVRTPSSLPSNIIWSLIGNGIYILCQWGTLVAIARLTNPAALGMFGLALALTAPIVLLLDLQLRVAYVTDVAESHPFADYLIIKSSSISLILGSSMLVGFLMTSDPLARLVIFGVGLSKAIESGDDLVNGFFQKAERFDLLAKSRIAKGVAALVAAAGILFWTRNVAAASFTIALVWLVTAAFVAVLWAPSFVRSCGTLRNQVNLRRLCGLVYSTFPLGVAQALITFQASLPRIVLQRVRGFEEVGVYTAISSLLVAGSAVMTAVGFAVMPRMATSFALNRHEEISRMRTRLVIGAAAVGSVSVLIAWTAGSRILALLFGAGFISGAHALIVLMVAMTVTFIASINDFILVAQRRFSSQIAIHIMSTAVSALGCVLLISPYGLIGSAMAVLLGAFVRVLANSVLLKRSVECHRGAPPLHPMLPSLQVSADGRSRPEERGAPLFLRNRGCASSEVRYGIASENKNSAECPSSSCRTLRPQTDGASRDAALHDSLAKPLSRKERKARRGHDGNYKYRGSAPELNLITTTREVRTTGEIQIHATPSK